MIRASSRSTACPGSSSLTRRTLTSLCICFSICSSECCEQSTRRTMRETFVALGRADGEALDVVAAPREHARDAHQRARLVLDEHGQRVDHGTGTERCSYSTRSSAAAPAGIIGKQCSAGSTRQSTTAVRPQRERLGERLVELVLGLGAQADRAVRLGELHVVGRVLREADLREPLLEEHVLPLPHHAEVAVVHDHDDDRQVLGHRGRELLARSSGSSRRRRRRRRSRPGGRPSRRRPPAARSPSCRARPR